MSDAESEASADFRPQDTSGLQSFEAYGNVGFGPAQSLPPPPPAFQQPGPPPEMQFDAGANISNEEARQALLNFVAQNCCFGSEAAEKMAMNSIMPSNAMHYELETFCEGRSSARTEVPYFGGPIDGPFNGPPPPPWAIPHAPSAHFRSEIVEIPVPHTDEIRNCGRCMGSKQITCNHCHGCGRRRCGSCRGRGFQTRHREGQSETYACPNCGGSGRRICGRCGGDGRITCPHCQGAGQVKAFIELTISYTNHVTDYIMEKTAMPDELVRNVDGLKIFQQTHPRVWPIVGFPVPEINQQSAMLVNQARSAYPIERQLQQRHTLTAIPITEVEATHKDTRFRFWVYGLQREVYCPDYPQQCCWGCNLL